MKTFECIWKELDYLHNDYGYRELGEMIYDRTISEAKKAVEVTPRYGFGMNPHEEGQYLYRSDVLAALEGKEKP